MSDADATTRLRARGRVTRSGDFDAVYRRGRSAGDRLLVVYAFRRADADPGVPARLGVSVSRKVGGAVERNRVKRVLRERFAELVRGGELPAGSDWVVIARPGVVEHLAQHGSAALLARLRTLTARLAASASAPSPTTATPPPAPVAAADPR